ncbi:hypothetical protein CCACVL1_12870 [Corchorus capsularis]|uniref:F-box associated beta-propeller type 1 domain-containing protein n=1 Tax=Corchorus capsularis TaxID=210143 RepID=A0A1R3IDB4_COCAP|nr:hypothetical protein CCACVL1_12870 [Corchorus capsularis]
MECNELEFSLESPKKNRYYMLGCCNGLLLLVEPRECLILWNPSTRECQQLPVHPRLSNDALGNYGFGYDQYTDDFKVIIFDYFLNGHLEAQGNIHIYSLKSNTWKIICGIPQLLIDQSKSGILVDEFLYWSSISSGLGKWVLGFNLKSDKFEKIRPPNDIVEQCHSFLSLGLIGGCLSLGQNHNHYGGGLIIDIWNLVKDGQSWIKIMSIMNLDGLANPKCWVPYCILNNGEVLLTYLDTKTFLYGEDSRTLRLQIQLYDPVNGKLRPGILRDYRQAITYDVQTLVSPKVMCSIESSSTVQIETLEFTELYGKDWSVSF